MNITSKNDDSMLCLLFLLLLIFLELKILLYQILHNFFFFVILSLLEGIKKDKKNWVNISNIFSLVKFQILELGERLI